MKKYSQDFTKIKDVERLLIDIGRILAHFKEGSDKEGLKLIDDARKKLHQYIVERQLCTYHCSHITAYRTKSWFVHLTTPSRLSRKNTY